MQTCLRKTIICLLLCFSTYSIAQVWVADYAVGYGTYKLTDIRDFQKSMVNTLGLVETDFFPGYITHSLSLGAVTDNNCFGAQISYLTTGGRLHRADYSGSYTVDIILNGYKMGAFYKHYFLPAKSALNVYMQFSSGLLSTGFRMKQTMKIYTESDTETSSLAGTGIYFEPLIGTSCRVAKGFHLTLSGGYEADIAGKLSYSGSQTQLSASWSGLRLYGGLIWVLP